MRLLIMFFLHSSQYSPRVNLKFITLSIYFVLLPRGSRKMIFRNVYKLKFLYFLLRNCQIWQKSKSKLDKILLQATLKAFLNAKITYTLRLKRKTDSKRCYGANSLGIKSVRLRCALSVRHSCFYMRARVVYKLCTSNVSKLSENGLSRRQKNVHNLATCE